MKLVFCLSTLSAVAIYLLFPVSAIAGGQPVSASDLQEIMARLHRYEVDANHLWTITAALIVFLMHGGYLLYEAGLVRSKNSINVAQKNLADAFVSAVCFYLIGFNIMFGPTNGMFGWGSEHYSLGKVSGWDHTFFVYQIVFCGTVATIVSGALAERLRFGAYLTSTAFISTIIYPVFGHWAWSNRLNPDNHTFLTEAGFIDFAGATVVSALGGWISLAGLLVVGARLGRFNEDGTTNHIQGHSIVLATFGSIVLWLGALAFNSGLAHAGSEELAHVVSNTILAGAFSGLTAMLIGRVHEGLYRPERSIYGLLGGIVAIAAGCHVFPTYATIIVGIVSGFVVYLGFEIMTRRFHLDDAVSAIPINGLCGAVGTILVGPLMMAERLGDTTRMEQTMVQLQGVGLSFLWAFPVAYIFFWCLEKFVGLRVTAEEEEIGLNTAEHGATIGTGLLQEALMDIVQGERDLTRRLDQSTGDESAEIAHLFNKFVERIQFLMISIAQNARVLNTSSDRLSKMAKMFGKNFDHIFESSSLLSESSRNVSKEVSSAANVAEEISHNVGTISESAGEMSSQLQEVSQMVANMTQAIRKMADNASDVSGVTTMAEDGARKAEESMQGLRDATQKISGIVDLIKAIANQTNLLALNAVIESAHAGEAGKGFVVVASEVKELASQTAKATEEISKRIAELQSNTQDMDEVVKSITGVISTINESISNISSSVNQQNHDTNVMSQKLDLSVGHAQQVAESISHVADGARSVSGNMRKAAIETDNMLNSIDEFTRETKENEDNASKVKKTSEDLSSVADELVAVVSKYKI